jgi:predicted amino acid dehydrogenase
MPVMIRSDNEVQDSFAFILHPIDPKRDVSRRFPNLGRLPAWLIDYLSLFFPPIFISEISGVRSLVDDRRARGWFVACPLTPRRMLSLPPQVVYRKIIQAGRLAERLGARILGLGAFTSVVGDGGLTVARHLAIPVTTGDSYTVAMAVRATERAARAMGIAPELVTAAVVGATGAIGSLCALMLADKVSRLLLIGKDFQRLRLVADKARAAGCRDVAITTDFQQLRQARLIITVTSAVEAVIQPGHLQPGAVVCDVARPRDVSRQVAEQRPDVLVIEGGMVELPGPVDFGFDFGFPAGMAYGCMAETMLLALEQRYESFTLGKEIELSQVTTIDRIGAKHGFKLGGFRSFERAIYDEEIAAVRAHSLETPSTLEDQPGVQSHPIVA